ncbi:hypothetical protein BGW41_001530 [Actinomortierella wolfii]|nr:hypothetical protein BGW41_001530 [Actinomortierella wolfii]
MSFSYGYRNPCVIQDPSAPTNVIVVGVNEESGSTLELTRVDISDLNNPKAKRFQNHTDIQRWSPATEKACVLYPREVWESNIPMFYVRQIGSRSYGADIMVNGTVIPGPLSKIDLVSIKLFSYTGAYKDREWVTAVAKQIGQTTASPWLALSRNGTKGYYDHKIQRFPPADALLSVGTYPKVTSPTTLVPGFLTVFDSTGSKGWVYKVTSSYVDLIEQWLADPVDVDMGGIILTPNAISVTMGLTGFILDKAPDDSIVLYSVSPNEEAKATLMRVAVNGNVPRYMAGRASTILDSNKVLLFGGLQGDKGSTIFHYFDTTTNTWSGPDLVAPYIPPPPPPSPPPPKSINVGAVAGGAAGGVVILLAILLFVYQRGRRRRHNTVTNKPKTDDVAATDRSFTNMAETHQLHHYHPPHNPHTSPEGDTPVIYAYEVDAHEQPQIIEPTKASYTKPPSLLPGSQRTAYRNPQDRMTKMHYPSPTFSENYISHTSSGSTVSTGQEAQSSSFADTYSKASAVPNTSRPLGNPQYYPVRNNR